MLSVIELKPDHCPAAAKEYIADVIGIDETDVAV